MEDGGQLRLEHSRTRFHKVGQHYFPPGFGLMNMDGLLLVVVKLSSIDAKIRSFQNHYIKFLPYHRA